MNFISDNAYGAAPQILAAVNAASAGTATSYGEDTLTKRVNEKLSAVFEREVFAFPVVTGTVANALSLATLCPSYGSIFCHQDAHIAVDECGAPEFFSGGAKLALLSGDHGKITPDAIEALLPTYQRGVHSSKPFTVSITQATEFGTVYTLAEIKAVADCARRNGMTLHMDGARFANALVSLGCTPAQMTWKAGVDALSFGATKNGALCAEAVILFDKARVEELEYRRKKAGHLLSKMRFISAQLDAYLENDLWLNNARHANTLARQLHDGLKDIAGVDIRHPVEANGVFASMPRALAARLREKGAVFYDWILEPDDRVTIRLIVSFATPQTDVAKFLQAARG